MSTLPPESPLKPKLIIVGASSAIAEHCLRLWLAKQAMDVHLVGRDKARLQAIAADLTVRSPASSLHYYQADFLQPTAIQTLVDTLMHERPADIILIAHGYLPNQAECEVDLQANENALHLNGVSPVLFAEAFAQHLAKVNRGRLALISSVAGDRGRKSNYVYGAAKGLINRYAQGLQHRFAKTGVNVIVIKPGPTDTPMTATFKQQGMKLAAVETVAEQIVNAIERGQRTVYVPQRWRLIMLIIQHLPMGLFKRLDI